MSSSNKTRGLELAIELEGRRRNLIRSKDFETLKTLLSPDIVYVHSTGGVDTFSSYFEKLINKSLVYLDVDYVDLSGTLFGDTLIVTGKMNAELILGSEQKAVQSIYMATWIRQSGDNWVMCAHQGAPRSA